jgi:ribonuclease-3
MPEHPESAGVDRLSRLQQQMGYAFSNHDLFERALTHSSAGPNHMERLEFLGDAVLGLVISQHLHGRFPERAEGELSRMRAAMVRRESLLKVAKRWKLDSLIQAGAGERTAKGIKSPSITANAVEALIGAIFEDGGWESARFVVAKAWHNMLKGIDQVETCDAKSRLQEFTQSKGWGLPLYMLVDLGTGHSPRFKAECWVNGKLVGTGQGERKKLAEIDAAAKGWGELNG